MPTESVFGKNRAATALMRGDTVRDGGNGLPVEVERRPTGKSPGPERRTSRAPSASGLPSSSRRIQYSFPGRGTGDGASLRRLARYAKSGP